ncbi:hypothetical protein RDI58_010430 [Solanum bulbocastanum]|uniref:Uncharacterized protein n=1 Tax=Solanum bulbocastanum TaxID=147425 RepID=A0AAN8YFE8_SOLBU
MDNYILTCYHYGGGGGCCWKP